MKKALIAMSGGVDSSVAAYLVKSEGYDCIGCTMKLYNNEDVGISKQKTCCSLSDVEDARSVSYKIGMQYYVFNFTDDFRKKIISNFIDSYEKGVTPNPCIDCNRFMKFDKLYERAKTLGYDYVVTGHYARIEKDGEEYILKKAVDDTKDQSYVLYFMTQNQLAHTLFPLGGMKKTQVREIADKNGFFNAHKPDSQDICFVPDGNYINFLEKNSDHIFAEGDFIDKNGKIIGRHKGIVGYTIGQRKGLGIAFNKPMYVCKINAEDNTVTLGDNKDLFNKRLVVENFNWILERYKKDGLCCKAKIRYNQVEQPAKIYLIDDDTIEIVFDESQRAITPGQAAVLYDNDIVIGGGIIKEYIPEMVKESGEEI